jgi:aromatic-amino-acid transaminase
MPFLNLTAQPPDPLLSAIGRFRADPRPEKIDLGVGVYRSEDGRTPVFGAVKAAERLLNEGQETKAYLGQHGDIEFVDLMRQQVIGDDGVQVSGMQTTGGTAALRIAAEVLARCGVRTVHVGTPAWANHLPILRDAGLNATPYDYFDAFGQRVDFDRLVEALSAAQPGDAALLQACCHNPTGADLTLDQWRIVADLVARKGLIPFIDVAYQGLGDGLEQDVAGARLVLAAAQQALVAVSCSKSFGLYRERTGALFAAASDASRRSLAEGNMLAIVRTAYSMPPDHGAAVVRLILQDPQLRADWLAELAEMRDRINSLRARLGSVGAIGPINFRSMAKQRGMFSLLPLTPDQVQALRERHAIHVVDSGRVNLAGLSSGQISRLTDALLDVLT